MVSWDTYAQPNKKFPGEYINFGDLSAMRMYGERNPVPVTLVPDPDGIYLAWVKTGEELPTWGLVYKSKFFNMLFPYGYLHEEEKGIGKAIRVRADVRELNEN